MGVSGSGKTTLGEKLSRLLGISFVEGDQFHSPMNIKKMKLSPIFLDVDLGIF